MKPFRQGFFGAFNLFGYRTKTKLTVKQAIKRDWENVGNDINKAITMYNEERNTRK